MGPYKSETRKAGSNPVHPADLRKKIILKGAMPPVILPIMKGVGK